jgi:peptide deformylase
LRYVQGRKALSKKCRPCETVTEGLLIGDRLLEVLKEGGEGCGLAANQIGVDFAACVIYVEKPIILVNPRIVGKFGKSFFQEGCLSFPGDYVMTERWTNIVVNADNHNGMLNFSFEKNPLECVCIQHEIDHLEGITMFDRVVDMEVINGKGKKR